MNQRSTKTNLVRVRITLDKLLMLLAEGGEQIPEGPPSRVRLTFDDTIVLEFWEDVPTPSPF